MNKKEFSEKIMKVLEDKKVSSRNNFTSKAFVAPLDEVDGELTIVGAQLTAVLSEQANVKYQFYKIEDEYLKEENRKEFIKKKKKQYPGIIFFICHSNKEDESRTIDTENNLMVVDNENFDAAVDLCGGINSYIKTMM